MARSEGQALADAKADELAALSWHDLDAYKNKTEIVTRPSGGVFRVTSSAYWDMEPWASGIEISVRVHPRNGPRRMWAYKARRVRGGPDDPVPTRPSP